MVFYQSKDETGGLPVIAFLRPNGKRVAVAANFTDTPVTLSLQMGRKYLNSTLAPHSFHTFMER